MSHSVLLDISRTVSRRGYPEQTGIDRVEQAYIHEVARNNGLFLACSGPYSAILDRTGVKRFQADTSSVLDMTGRLAPWRDQKRRLAETILRKHALVFDRTHNLSQLLRQCLQDRFRYLNVGHTNLKQDLMHHIRTAYGRHIEVMVHDTIPLDHPEYARAETIAAFSERMRCVCECADMVIYPSRFTRDKAEQWFRRWGRIPPGQVVALGAEKRFQIKRSPAQHPAFLMLGTIEPRKGHAMILKIWERFGLSDDAPHLHIIGRRGWNNTDVFTLLDSSEMMGRTVFEHGPRPDADIARYMSICRALLFPTKAEGFGLPVAEAVLAGLPVIASDLDVLREVHDGSAQYLQNDAENEWLAAVKAMSHTHELKNQIKTSVHSYQSWTQHFQMLNFNS